MLVDAGPHPNPAKAADGKRLHRLVPDPITAAVVERIFAEYLSGIGIFAIAQRLTGDGIPSPSAYDPKRNSHRNGIAWSKAAVRTILINPRYTGHQVWNKQRKEELLIDVEDVALGHETKLKWNPESTWVFSDKQVHEPLVSKQTFDAVQRRMANQGPRSAGRQVMRTQHGYAFKSRLLHKSCGRRMQGNWAHGEPCYRCRFPQEYAIANTVDHPLNVYLREDDLRAQVDPWLSQAFAPAAVEHTLATLDTAQPSSDGRAGEADVSFVLGPADCSYLRSLAVAVFATRRVPAIRSRPGPS